jgi:hypothetical protein
MREGGSSESTEPTFHARVAFARKSGAGGIHARARLTMMTTTTPRMEVTSRPRDHRQPRARHTMGVIATVASHALSTRAKMGGTHTRGSARLRAPKSETTKKIALAHGRGCTIA